MSARQGVAPGGCDAADDSRLIDLAYTAASAAGALARASGGRAPTSEDQRHAKSAAGWIHAAADREARPVEWLLGSASAAYPDDLLDLVAEAVCGDECPEGEPRELQMRATATTLAECPPHAPEHLLAILSAIGESALRRLASPGFICP